MTDCFRDCSRSEVCSLAPAFGTEAHVSYARCSSNVLFGIVEHSATQLPVS